MEAKLHPAVEAAVAHLEPDEDAVTRLLYPLLDDDTLRIVAAYDYGSDVDEYFEHLKRIRDGGLIPRMASLMPREVLSLAKHSDPDVRPIGLAAKPYPGGVGPADQVHRGHLVRLFACASLMRSSSQPGASGYEDESYLTIQAIRSVMSLGEEFTRAFRRLLAWRLLTPSDYEDEQISMACGLLVLADIEILGGAKRIALVQAIRELVESRRKRIVKNGWKMDRSFRICAQGYRSEEWRELVEVHICRATVKDDLEAQGVVRELGYELLGV